MNVVCTHINVHRYSSVYIYIYIYIYMYTHRYANDKPYVDYCLETRDSNLNIFRRRPA